MDAKTRLKLALAKKIGESTPAPAQTPVQTPTYGELVETDSEVSVEFEPLKLQIAELQAAIDQQLPGMPTILRDIHMHIAKDPEAVTILTDEEIGTIVQGLDRIQGSTLTVNQKTGKTRVAKSMPITAGML